MSVIVRQFAGYVIMVGMRNKYNLCPMLGFINCSLTKFIAIIVNVCLFMQNFPSTILTSRVTSTPVTFCVSRDLKFSLNRNFKQLNSIGGNLILKVK